MTPARTGAAFDWEHEGRLLGESFDGLHAIVVLGEDPTATALVALGIGRAQALRRRVAVADLLGDAPPITALVNSDDAHGITDSFSFGVSLNRIAHPVAGSGELFVMPSGTEPLDFAAILPNERWRRLSGGFREVGALLILAAPASAPEISTLVTATEGAVLVGEVVPAELPVATVLGTVREPAPSADRVPKASRAAVASSATGWRSRRTLHAAVGGALAAIIAFIGLWLAERPLVNSDRRVAPPDTAGAVAASLGAGQSAEASGAIARADEETPPAVVNAADSARAAAWVVELVKENTPAGAQASLARLRPALPAATVGAVVVNDGTWYRVVGGAHATREGADSLLRTLRSSGTLGDETGIVVRLPLAFLVRERVGSEASSGEVRRLQDRGLPAYALLQDDRTANIYVGAFETPEQAVFTVPALRQAGLSPQLAHRLGRTF